MIKNEDLELKVAALLVKIVLVSADGQLIAGVLASTSPKPIEYVNGKDQFGQSGTPAELLAAYGMDAAHIAQAAKKVMERK